MNQIRLNPALAALAAILIAVFGAFTYSVTVDDHGHTTIVVKRVGAPAPVALSTKVDTNDPGRAPDTRVTAPLAATKAVAATDAGDHSDLKTEAPVGAPLGQIEQAQQAADDLATTDQLPIVQPDAAPSQRGCVSAFVRNYSSRRGVRPRLFVLHYTVSPNRPGVGDVNAVVNLFNTPAFQASSNYVIDREGNCKYIVRESDKAWTQAAANPFSISVEIVNSGKEGSLISGAGLAKLGTIVSDATKRWNIPLQRGAVSGCTPTIPGVITHQMLGACGGGHVDTSPYSASTQEIIAAAIKARGGKSAVKRVKLTTAEQRRTCNTLNFHRARAHKIGKWFPSRRLRATRLKSTLPKGSCPSRFRGEPAHQNG